jgi:hypothetical protein
MAWNRRSAEPRLAALCDSSVRDGHFHSASHGYYPDTFVVCCKHRPEPHILLFRRPLGTDPQSGRIDPELERLAREEYKNQFGIRGK